LVAFSLIAALVLFACSFVKKELSPPPVPEQKLRAVPTPTPQPEPTPVHHKHRRRHHHAAHSNAAQPSETPTPAESTGATPGSVLTPTPLMSPSPTPAAAALSIGGDTAISSRDQAEKLIGQANGNLKNADRMHLSGDDAAAYDQARSLVSAAAIAFKQKDYLAASSLAEKAAVLSDRFGESKSSP
jgi:hypothetical protein